MELQHGFLRPSACALALSALVLGPVACGNDSGTTDPDDITPEVPAMPDPLPDEETRTPTETLSEDLSLRETSDGPVVLETEITLWSEERIELRYTLSNGDETPLVVWDRAPGDTFGGTPAIPADSVTDIVLGGGRPILFKGIVYRDDCLGPAGPITVSGRALELGGSLSGTAARSLPLSSRCEQLTETDPPEIAFCVGYSTANTRELEEALEPGHSPGEGGRYESGRVIDQRQSCVTLSR